VIWFDLFPTHTLKVFIYFKTNPKFKDTFNLTFHEDGIKFKTNMIDSNLDWALYSKLLEDKNIIVLKYSTNDYTVIPKRAFANENDLIAFLELSKRKIGINQENKQ